jgi:hypothetical protein
MIGLHDAYLDRLVQQRVASPLSKLRQWRSLLVGLSCLVAWRLPYLRHFPLSLELPLSSALQL